MAELSPEQDSALHIAHKLADLGVPIFSAPARTDTPGEFFYPSAWQNFRAEFSHDQIDKWRPGWCLAMVCGVVFDVADVDPRNGGDLADLGQLPAVYGRVATPSAGEHLYIARTHLAKCKPSRGIDLQSGADVPDATGSYGRGFVFLPPTERPAKFGPNQGKSVAYRWELEPVRPGTHIDDGLTHLVALATEARSPRVATIARPQPVDVPVDDDDPFAGAATTWTAEEGERLVARQVLAVEKATQGEINPTLGGAARVLGRFVAGGYLAREDAEIMLHAALVRGGVHDDGWNAAHGLKWTADSVISGGLRRGAAEPWTVAEKPPPPKPKPVNTDTSFTDSALAELAAAEVMADRYVWNGAMGWQRYARRRWEDADEVQACEDVRLWARDHYRTALKAEMAEPGSAVNAVGGWRKVQSAARIGALLKLSRGIVFTDASLFDQHPHEFSTESGVIDLETGHVREGSPSDLMTKVAGTSFDPEASSELFEAFVQRILPDPDVREFVQRLFGYAMLGVVREHILPIFTGTGANGKGTLRDAVMAAFGDYSTEVDPEILLSQGTSGSRHLTFLMELRGRRLLFCSETEKDRTFSEATMKRLTGGDPIQANRMHKDPITFLPSHTLIMCTNHLPRISADDDASWRRLRVVPFDVVIPEVERDPGLPERLKAPDVRRAVLAWVYRGYQQYQLLGLAAPDSVKARTQGYRADNDAVGRFVADRIVFGTACSIGASDLYRAYEDWCSDEGITLSERLSKIDFGRDMARRGHAAVKRGGLRVYSGLMAEGPIGGVPDDRAF